MTGPVNKSLFVTNSSIPNSKKSKKTPEQNAREFQLICSLADTKPESNDKPFYQRIGDFVRAFFCSLFPDQAISTKLTDLNEKLIATVEDITDESIKNPNSLKQVLKDGKKTIAEINKKNCSFQQQALLLQLQQGYSTGKEILKDRLKRDKLISDTPPPTQSKSSHAPPRLENIGNSCYMDSSLELFWIMRKDLSEKIKNIKRGDSETQEEFLAKKNIAHALDQFYQASEKRDQAKIQESLEHFREVIFLAPHSDFNVSQDKYAQYDSESFIRLVLDALDVSLPSYYHIDTADNRKKAGVIKDESSQLFKVNLLDPFIQYEKEAMDLQSLVNKQFESEAMTLNIALDNLKPTKTEEENKQIATAVDKYGDALLDCLDACDVLLKNNPNDEWNDLLQLQIESMSQFFLESTEGFDNPLELGIFYCKYGEGELKKLLTLVEEFDDSAFNEDLKNKIRSLMETPPSIQSKNAQRVDKMILDPDQPPPEYICMQLLRHSFDGSSIKNSIPVNYPLNGIVKLPFHKWRKDLENCLEPDEYEYEIVGVQNHSGSRLTGGHYTADIKNPITNEWTHCNDMSSKKEIAKFKQDQAYFFVLKLTKKV